MKTKANILITLVFFVSILGFQENFRIFVELLASLDTLRKYGEISRIWETAQAGEFALNDEARFAIRLLKKFGVPNYRFSKKSEIDWTHLMVGIWPIQYKKDSQYLIFLEGEQQICPVIGKIKEVKLGRCS